MDDRLDAAGEPTSRLPPGLLAGARLCFSPPGTFGGDDTRPDEEILTAFGSAAGALAPSLPPCSTRPVAGRGTADYATRPWRTR
jgi:hypothetical protein